MRWAALMAIAGVLVAGCGDSGATKEERHAAYERGYSAGEEAGRFEAAFGAEEEREAGYEEGFEAGEEEVLELEDQLSDEFQAQDNRLEEVENEAESAQLELEEEAADEAEELEDLEEEIEAEERCERYDYCYP